MKLFTFLSLISTITGALSLSAQARIVLPADNDQHAQIYAGFFEGRTESEDVKNTCEQLLKHNRGLPISEMYRCVDHSLRVRSALPYRTVVSGVRATTVSDICFALSEAKNLLIDSYEVEVGQSRYLDPNSSGPEVHRRRFSQNIALNDRVGSSELKGIPPLPGLPQGAEDEASLPNGFSLPEEFRNFEFAASYDRMILSSKTLLSHFDQEAVALNVTYKVKTLYTTTQWSNALFGGNLNEQKYKTSRFTLKLDFDKNKKILEYSNINQGYPMKCHRVK